MTREEFLKEQIKNSGYNLKSFAAELNIPYTTLLSMLKDNIGGASVETVIEICHKLHIPVEVLRKDNTDFSFPKSNAVLTTYELMVLNKFRLLSKEEQDEIEHAINYKISRKEDKYKKGAENLG